MTPFDEFNIYDSNEDDLFDDENQIKVENQRSSLKNFIHDILWIYFHINYINQSGILEKKFNDENGGDL